jgi:hypothetical protein
VCSDCDLRPSISPLQLSDSAKPTETAAEVPSTEEASLPPVETLLCVQWCNQVSAKAVKLGVDCLGPGHLWYE